MCARGDLLSKVVVNGSSPNRDRFATRKNVVSSHEIVNGQRMEGNHKSTAVIPSPTSRYREARLPGLEADLRLVVTLDYGPNLINPLIS